MVKGKGDSLLLERIPVAHAYLVYICHDIRFRHPHLQLSVFERTDFQKLVRELLDTLGISEHDAVILLSRGIRIVGKELLQRADNQRQRRPQLMGELGRYHNPSLVDLFHP